jgi:hypothetical protein
MSTVESFIELSDEDLDAAIAGSRQRGVYDEKLLDYIQSGKRGVEINLAEGVHAGKKAPSVKTGYESARDRLENGKTDLSGTDEEKETLKGAAKNTKVILKGERVFLVRSDVATQAAAA